MSISGWFPSVCFQPGSSLSYRVVTMHPSTIGCLYKHLNFNGVPNQTLEVPDSSSTCCLLLDQFHVALANLTQLGWTAPCTRPMWGMVELLGTHACVSASVGPHHPATLERQGQKQLGETPSFTRRPMVLRCIPDSGRSPPAFLPAPCTSPIAFSGFFFSGQPKLRPKEWPLRLQERTDVQL